LPDPPQAFGEHRIDVHARAGAKRFHGDLSVMLIRQHLAVPFGCRQVCRSGIPKLPERGDRHQHGRKHEAESCHSQNDRGNRRDHLGRLRRPHDQVT